MNELDTRLYKNWTITPRLLSLEREIVWFRPPTPYLYLRESVHSETDHQTEIRPYHDFVDCEIIGVAIHHRPGNPSRDGEPRRVWLLNHKIGLDGLDPPAPGGEFAGFIVSPESIKAGAYSELGVLDREVTPAEIAEATQHRGRYLSYMAAFEIEQAAKRKRWQARHLEKLKMTFNKVDEIDAEDARLAADDIARQKASAKAARGNPYKA